MGRYGAKWFKTDWMSAKNTGQFVGEFRHSIDDKGRLTIPSQWRPEVDSEENNFLALPSLTEKSVTIYPPKMIEQLNERLSQVSLGDRQGQRAIRRFMSKAHAFKCDKQGRINLNDKLIEHAELKKSVVVLGEVSKFMIYDEEFYDRLMAYEDGEDDLADIVKGFGL